MQTTETDTTDIEGNPFGGGWPDDYAPPPPSDAARHSGPTAFAEIPLASEMQGALLLRGLDDFTGHPHPYDGKCKVCGKPLANSGVRSTHGLPPAGLP